MADSIPIFEAKNRLPYFIHKAETEGPVFLSRRGKNVAVIISQNEFDEKIKKGTNNVKVIVTDGVGNKKTLKMKVAY